MAHKISRDAAKLAAAGAPVATVRVAHRAVGPSFFSHRSPTVPPVVSAKVVAALKRLDPPMLDGQGFVTMDPRHTRGPWVQQLVAEVPELAGGRGGGGMTPDHSHVSFLKGWAVGWGFGRGLAWHPLWPCRCCCRWGRLLAPARPGVRPRNLPRPKAACLPPALQVWEEMNLAYANHEIIADFTTAAFLWFESGCACFSCCALVPPLCNAAVSCRHGAALF